MKKTPRKELKYKIVRVYNLMQNERTIRTQISLKHAQEHCYNPESAYTTCKKPANLKRTAQVGPWFDIYRSL